MPDEHAFARRYAASHPRLVGRSLRYLPPGGVALGLALSGLQLVAGVGLGMAGQARVLRVTAGV